MRFEDVENAEQIGTVFARLRRLPEKALLRRIGADNLGKLVSVDGIVVRATQVWPTIVSAVFRFLQCLAIVREEQKTARFTKGSTPSACPISTKENSLHLIQEESKLKNT